MTPEIHDPISRVQAMLEEENKIDREQFLSPGITETSCRRKKYDGKPEKVFSWCENLEEHLSAHDWESIPNEAIKKMLLGCITGSARQEIVLLQPPGAAFENG